MTLPCGCVYTSTGKPLLYCKKHGKRAKEGKS
jgi:hypothetical protein